MPTQQEIEDYIRQSAGAPIQGAFNQAGQAAETGVNNAGAAALAMKQAALAKMAANPQVAQQAPPTPPIPQVQPNSPTMSPQDQDSRMNSMIAAPLSGGTPMSFDSADAQRTAQMNQNSLAAPASGLPSDLAAKLAAANQPEPSAPRQFPHIQAKMKSGQPITTQDIRATLKGPQEVTPELNKKLGYGSDEDEDDNNKAGSAEGSYGD